MWHLTKNLKNLTIHPFAINYNNLQSTRWKRKPLWMPTAKSKVFRVAPRLVIPVEEEVEIRRLYNNYRTQVKSIRNYLRNRYYLGFMTKSDTEHQEKAVEEDFVRCNSINDQWNAACKIVREKRIDESLKVELQKAQEKLETHNVQKAEQQAIIEEIVRNEKEASKTFITQDNIDAAIEQALANPVDHNYAIDLEGNKFEGRDTEIAAAKEKIVSSQ